MPFLLPIFLSATLVSTSHGLVPSPPTTHHCQVPGINETISNNYLGVSLYYIYNSSLPVPTSASSCSGHVKALEFCYEEVVGQASSGGQIASVLMLDRGLRVRGITNVVVTPGRCGGRRIFQPTTLCCIKTEIRSTHFQPRVEDGRYNFLYALKTPGNYDALGVRFLGLAAAGMVRGFTVKTTDDRVFSVNDTIPTHPNLVGIKVAFLNFDVVSEASATTPTTTDTSAATTPTTVATTSTTNTPPATTPTTDTPAAATPTTDTPAAATPTTDTPAAATPTTDTPAAATPTTDTSAATTPTTTSTTNTPPAATPTTHTSAAATPTTDTSAATTPTTAATTPTTDTSAIASVGRGSGGEDSMSYVSGLVALSLISLLLLVTSTVLAVIVAFMCLQKRQADSKMKGDGYMEYHQLQRITANVAGIPPAYYSPLVSPQPCHNNTYDEIAHTSACIEAQCSSTC